jgi:hypothetical protein
MDRILPTLGYVRAWQVREQWFYAENEELAPPKSSQLAWSSWMGTLCSAWS